jgi:hypothetical protein
MLVRVLIAILALVIYANVTHAQECAGEIVQKLSELHEGVEGGEAAQNLMKYNSPVGVPAVMTPQMMDRLEHEHPPSASQNIRNYGLGSDTK